MLVVGAHIQKVKWPEANIVLDLLPLTEDVDQGFVEQTISEVRDDDGKLISVKRDSAEYARLVGRHCIKGWSGVVDAEKKPLKCTPEAIGEFMMIEPAQVFVFGKVKSLSMHLHEEKNAAKKD